jgi:nicotinate-nucleotide adenylyltransferase
MAVFARDAFALDQVLFVPARRSPCKAHGPVLPDAARLALLENAVAGERGLAVSPCELQRDAPSYTVETLRSLQAGRAADWFLLIGADQLPGLPDWREYLQLREMLTGILVAPRFGEQSGRIAVPDGAGFHPLDAPAIGLSSSLIRRRLAAGLGVRGMLPDAVLHRIAGEGWYRDGS